MEHHEPIVLIGIPEQRISGFINDFVGLDIDFAKFTVFVPYPGTAEYDKLYKAGALEEPENWDRFTSYPTSRRPPNESW